MSEFEAEYQGDEVEVEAIGVEVSIQPIELYKVLKIADAVSGGGEAKYAITEGYVAVNGEIETRKRRKLYDGDLIEFNQEYYVVICDAPVTEPEVEVKKPQPSTSKKSRDKQSNKSKGKSTPAADHQVSHVNKASESVDNSEPKPRSGGGRGEIKFF